MPFYVTWDIYIYIYIYITDNLCLHIFVSIFSNHCIVVLISGWNWLTNFVSFTGSRVLSCPSQAIFRGWVYCKSIILRFIYTDGINFFFFFKYGKFVSQFQPDIKTNIQWFERIETKIWRQRLSVIFHQIYLNKETLPIHAHTHTHIYMYMYI